jgi:cytochrome c oxidase subunit II
MSTLPLFPQQASVQAGQVDAIYFFMVAVTAFFSLLIAGLIVFFAVKYRRRSDDEVGVAIHGSLVLELLWTFIPFFIAMGMFAWGAKVFFDLYRVPAGAMEIFVVGKQWMWKVQHASGQREINELHVPVGRPVKLIMGSEDVIHSYYIPAFRVKADVIPGRYNTLWFQANRPGRYHLFCAEYCGTKHSGMIGSVVALEPAEFQSWLSGGAVADSPAAAGEKLFQSLACHTCHMPGGQGRGPVLTNLFGHEVELQGGGKVVADEAYLRESIVLPQAKVVAGFPPIMPPFQGMVTEEQLLQLIAYLKSLTGPAASPQAPQQK